MKFRRQHASRGFTSTELLTVVVIAAVGLALISPAVLRARADARDYTCKLRLKRLGLAMHNYHDAHHTFPPAWTNHHPDSGAHARYGWQVSLLPFIEHAPLFQRLDHFNQATEPKSVFQETLPIYRCPSDPTPDTNVARGDFGTSNYSGSFGPLAAPRWSPGETAMWWIGRAPTPVRTDGVFHLNSRTSFRNITDGTSNTFMVGERSATSAAGIWMGVRGNDFEDDQTTDCSFGNEVNSGPTSFSSRHSAGGANFLLCDGRAVFINEKIDSHAVDGRDLGTYQKLSHKADGNVLGEF